MTRELWRLLRRVERIAGGGDSAELRSAFDELTRADLRQTVSETPGDVLERIAWLTAPHRASMIDEHRCIDDTVRQRLVLLGRWDDVAHAVAS